jgi:hypothetical protein
MRGFAPRERFMNKLMSGTVLVLLAVVGTAQAAEDEGVYLGKRGGVLVQTDADFGGDDVATVYYEDDDEQDVKAGQGVALSIGGFFRPIEDSRFRLEASIGYKFVLTAASNADISLTRTLLQLGAYYEWPTGFYLGGGVVQHLSPELNGDGFFEDITFDDATGFNVEIGWKWVALHYTQMTYEHEFFEDVDASSIGIRATYRFGQY